MGSEGIKSLIEGDTIKGFSPLPGFMGSEGVGHTFQDHFLFFVSVPFRGLWGLKGFSVTYTGPASFCFSPLPGFMGSEGWQYRTCKSCKRRFSPLPGFMGSEGVLTELPSKSRVMFQSPSGVYGV